MNCYKIQSLDGNKKIDTKSFENSRFNSQIYVNLNDQLGIFTTFFSIGI